MNANLSPIVWSMAILLVNAGTSCGASNPPAVVPASSCLAAATQLFADPPAAEMNQEDFNKALNQAVQILVDNGDQEAFDLRKKAKENGGRVEVSKEEALKFIERAKKVASGANNGGDKEPEKPAEPTPEKELEKPDPEKVKEAVKVLAKKGDKQAQAVIDHARANRGELKVTDDEGRKFIERANELEVTGVLPKADEPSKDEPSKDEPTKDDPDKPDMEKAKEAVKLLAKKGDKEAKEAMETARRNRTEITLTDEQARAFIERAVDKDLIKDGKEDPADKMPPQQVKQLIKALAERGDRDAKAIMRKAKKNDDEITYTEEEEIEIIKNAKKQGLIN
jgi:hypothetical protein